MDDEEDRRLLDIIGDVQALNDYLHGSNNKSIEEDDVTNAAYGPAGSFFAGSTAGANSDLKHGPSSLGEFAEDSTGTGLQLSSSLSFIEDELGEAASPGGVELGGEDQPFDILQKSLLEADITEQTLAQEALLDSQPPSVQATSPFPSQLVSGGYGGGTGVVTTATATFSGGQFLQGISQLPNGSAGHIQVLGPFGAGGGVMTLSSLDRSPQILLRPGAPAATAQVFTPPPAQLGQVGLPFKNIPLQNIIIQRGPGGTQTLVRPIQPKPPQSGSQTLYSLGIQPTTTTANVANTASPVGGQYTANGSILVHSPLGQGQAQGQYSVALTPATTVHNGPTDPNNTLLTNQNAVQLVAGQNFTATAGGQLIVNQGVAAGVPVGGWSTFPGSSPVPGQAACNQRLTLVGPAAGVVGRGQVSGSPVQRLVVTHNSSSLSPGPAPQEQQDYTQDSSSPGLSQDGSQAQLVNLLGTKATKTTTSISQDSLLIAQGCTQKRPAPHQLTRGGMILQQLRKDHSGVLSTDYRRFTSLEDTFHRLMPYHVFQGAAPNHEFYLVDEEFESVATQVLKRTQAMVNKYRRLLMVEAERSSPSSEMVMIDRTFNQEERSNLTQDKRMVLVDPDGFLEEFCCGVKPSPALPDPYLPPPSTSCRQTGTGPQGPGRTDPQAGYGDPGGGGGGKERGGLSQHIDTSAKSILDLKRTRQTYSSNNSLVAASNHQHASLSPPTALAAGPTHYQVSQLSSPSLQPHLPPELPSPPATDTDSVLEAAVNSILEC
ncbi:BRD4-interacting chromatin-remodeling complex-associated protein-like [Osmerus eperlanus]|uniref:BRD4-interacting chromatin-remodeling complex-associated protein-like n=1 Tax=Osmerus eperlanus TaxID=29151 RepID=UPI002E128F45